MKKVLRQLTALVILCLLTVVVAMASSVDKYINDLKSQDPEVRAKAAYELGCT
jgi:hypothetical protein